MSVVVTVQSGFDLEYYLTHAAKEPERSPGRYYVNASTQGEAPGRWIGEGCQALGVAGEVAADTFRQGLLANGSGYWWEARRAAQGLHQELPGSACAASSSRAACDG